jgi:beta-lactamase class A
MYRRWLIFLVVTLAGLAAVYPVLNHPTVDQKAVSEVSVDPQVQLNYRKLMTELEASAAKFHGETGILVKDLNSGHSIGINSSKLFPSASLVKLPIMAALYAAQDEGKINLDDSIVLKKQHKIRSCSKVYFSRTGTKWPIRELIKRMITESDNTATNMLVDTLGFGYINQKFVDFGLKNTDLRRGVMDLVWRNAGIENYTTADDMAFLLEKIYHGELVSAKASAEMLAVLKQQKVNDRLPKGLPADLTIAHKTGLLRDTVSDCGIVYTPEGNFIICVLTQDFRTYRQAKRFIGKVAECAYDRCYRTVKGDRI